MANNNHFSSITCYNVTILNTNYYNDFFGAGRVSQNGEQEIKAGLDEYVVAQKYAKKAISVAVYNYY